MAAGDVAVAVLDAGLVAWGLKLYEYRAQLLSRAGATVCAASAALALGNVAGGPALARALLGLGTGTGMEADAEGSGELAPAPAPALALAFAARNVTIALAGPAMAMLGGGDAGLSAAMVVASGIVYQMALGFGAGRWLERRVVGPVAARWGLRSVASAPAGDGGDGKKEASARVARQGGHDGAGMQGAAASKRANDPAAVAAGVTVGINAAAMGTAYLYEAQSEAAPHAALSMMALGIMTVVFSSVSPLARWVAGSVSG